MELVLMVHTYDLTLWRLRQENFELEVFVSISQTNNRESYDRYMMFSPAWDPFCLYKERTDSTRCSLTSIYALYM